MSADITSVIGSYVPLLRKGNEWESTCPFEEHSEPLAIIGGRWRCFGCGAHETDDTVVGFLMLAEKCDAAKAQQILDNGRDWSPTLLKPTPPLSRFSIQRALDHPDKTILIVDVRKAAILAEKLLPRYLVANWPDGNSRWDGLDPLRGRTVLLMPSPEGAEDMERLEAVLADPAGLNCTGKVVNPLDLSTWAGTAADLIAWAKANVRPIKLLKNSAPQVGGETHSATKVLDTPAVAEPNPAARVAPPSLATQGAGNVAADSTPPPESPPPPAGPSNNFADMPQDALERDLSAPAPDAPPPSEFPPEATVAKPRKRRLRVAGGTDIDIPDPDAEPLPVEMGEDMLALRFAAQHGMGWRYVKRWGQWYHYDGDGWRTDDVDLIDRLSVEFCRQAVHWPEASALTPEGKRRIAQRRTAGQVRDLARHDRNIAATVSQWDADPYIVGVPGGVYCIDTGKIIEGDREQYVTKRCAVAPAHGTPKRWLEHLNRMMEGDSSMINFLHLYAGYCATGDVSQQCFAFLYGMGQTGKGTFLLTLGELLGDYAVFSEASTFLKRQGEKHLSELARFNNARLVIVDEVPSGSVWNEERIKRCTGGGKLTVNFMQKDPFDMEIKFKLAFAGNTKPQLRRVGKEMQRRVKLVRCNAMVPDEQVDQHFRQKMIAEEGPQILNWILEGAQHWKREGLPLPEGIQDATKDYMEGEDHVGDWLAECTEQKGETRRPDAYANFKTWFLKQGNDHAWGPQAWWSAMEDRGYSIRRTPSDRFVKGLSLRLGANL